ncbi:MAG: C39 family peptidase [Solirubrobacterales bacterium]
MNLSGVGGNVTIVTAPRAVTIEAPTIKQKLRNNCEATALQILLRTAGRKVTQLDLQAQLRKSGTLDPTGAPGNRTWGDPDAGFVGRPEGGGTAGGFGVYPGPVKSLAARHGVALRNLTDRPARSLYSTLLAGHAVMVWVGLGDGPYSSWQSPTGRTIKVNLNEHTVVLNGLDENGQLSVVNPLTGTAERWSKRKFESMWRLLGKRALST